jgi:hypothetical protein
MMAKYYLLESNGNVYCADSDTVKGAWDEARQLDASYPNDAPHTVVELIPVPRPDPLAEAHARIAELEAQLAARPQVTGVVVTHDMVERAYDAWRATIVGGDAFRNALTAALTSATLVPLASALSWDSTMDGSPLYRGIAEVRDGK